MTMSDQDQAQQPGPILFSYRVGQPYHPSRRTWPETIQYNYRSSGHELVCFFRRPTDAEVAALTRGGGALAFYAADDQIILLCQFTGPDGRVVIPWSDAPYSWHRLPPRERTFPPTDLAPGERAALMIVLVDAADGLIQGLRLLSLSPSFTQALHRAIAAQAAYPWDPHRYDQRLAALFQRYPDPQALLVQATSRMTITPLSS